MSIDRLYWEKALEKFSIMKDRHDEQTDTLEVKNSQMNTEMSQYESNLFLSNQGPNQIWPEESKDQLKESNEIQVNREKVIKKRKPLIITTDALSQD